MKPIERKWDRDKIRRAIRALWRAGEDISYNALARRNQALVSAANYHFGSYKRAVVMAGIDYTNVVAKPRWNPGKIVKLIKLAHKSNIDLNWRAVQLRRDELGQAATAAVRQRLFGSWNAALRAAGLRPDRVWKYHKWPRNQIIDELRTRHKQGKPINSGIIQKDLAGLYGAAVRCFGSYDDALRAAGLNPQLVRERRQWTRQQAVEEMKRFVSEHGRLTQSWLRRHDPGLEKGILHYYRNIAAARQALVRAGYPVPEPLRRGKAATRRAANNGQRVFAFAAE